MKRALLLLGLSGCATAGVAEDFTWAIQTPSPVQRGSVFQFTARATRVSGKVVNGVAYRYEIRASGGNATSGTGYTGEPQKVRAPLTSGPAVLVLTCPDRKGRDVEVQKAPFDVK